MTGSIRRLLIANRGEIVGRVARTARRLGIETVGVYSDLDRNALHVDEVDLAVALGGESPADSYLRGEAVIAVAVRAGCDAVHPGYGFLAENAAFAASVVDAGLTWVGPTAAQIRLLGDKVAAKRAAIAAGVPTTPIHEVPFDGVTAGPVPAGITMPALVKAASGGGGRGMRVVRDESELAAAITAASREAASAFGDGTVFVEPYLDRGRHIEVQIMGDAHGNVVHFYERDCSVQRRNQKLIEEAPAPALDDATRSTLHDGALALARHVGYQSAGTVEFLVGDDGTVSFLEVNTRLQVEHPVTEAITGVDLVELQLTVATGAALGITQADIRTRGHAIEARIVAEDPAAGWLPSTGRIDRFDIPGVGAAAGAAGVEITVHPGVRAGSDVSASYDSLIAKVVGFHPGPDARRAVARGVARALRTATVTGIRTNVGALMAVLESGPFLDAELSTRLLDDHPALTAGTPLDSSTEATLLLAATLATEQANRRADVHWGFAPSGWRNVRTQGQRRSWVSADDGVSHDVEYVIGGDGAIDVWLGPHPQPTDDGTLTPDERVRHAVRVIDRAADRIAIEVDGVRSVVRVDRTPDGVFTSSPFESRSWLPAARFADHDHDIVGGGPHAPLPGTIIAVNVSAGDVVSEGQALLVLEAMKMEHTITAPSAAVVAEVKFAVGDRVDTGDLLVVLDAQASGGAA